jgi:hypothetical protein
MFAQRGWFIGAYDVNEASLFALVADLGAENCVASVLDTTNMLAVTQTMAQFGTRTGELLLLVAVVLASSLHIHCAHCHMLVMQVSNSMLCLTMLE